MKKFISLFLSVFYLSGSLPLPALAADAYADTVTSSSLGGLYTPNNALGEPDGQFADFMEDDLIITLDMGDGGVGDLEITYALLQIGALIRVSLLSADQGLLASTGMYLDANAITLTIPYTDDTPYQYVMIESLEDKGWRLDAVKDLGFVDVEEPVDEPVAEEPIDEPVVEPVADAGDLIRTSDSSSVYLVGEDGKRHAFPNVTVFESWNYAFEDVVLVSTSDLASFALGGNVTVKPASYLVKIQSDPRVFVVAPDAELRWIVDESTAIAIYGVDWADDVIDIDVTFWRNYTTGANIDEASDVAGWDIPEHRY